MDRDPRVNEAPRDGVCELPMRRLHATRSAGVEPTAEAEGVMDYGEGERWNAALLNLARAVGAEVTLRIENVTRSDCTVVLEKSDGQFFKKMFSIETLEDPSSRQFEVVIAEAKAGLGVMTEYRGFKYKLSNRSALDLTCDAEIWATDPNARGVGASPISRHTGVTPRDAERTARHWIDRQQVKQIRT